MSIIANTWYYIPGYNGYEYCDGMVRSMKFFNVYPNGKLVMPTGKNEKYYILSNNQNERIKLSITDIITLIENNPKTIRNWQDNNISSRNIVTRKPVVKGKKQEIYHPVFKIRKNAIRFFNN